MNEELKGNRWATFIIIDDIRRTLAKGENPRSTDLAALEEIGLPGVYAAASSIAARLTYIPNYESALERFDKLRYDIQGPRREQKRAVSLFPQAPPQEKRKYA